LFMLLVPPLTILFQRLGRKYASILFCIPFFLSPLFYLTTGKVGWILLLPLALAFAGPRAVGYARTHRWIRQMFRAELHPYHALLFAEALSWILFRYLVLGRRIAHIPTLFLETVFVAAFLALFWAVAFLIARLVELNFAIAADDVFKRITVAALPLIALPFIPLFVVPTTWPRVMVIATLVLIAIIAMRLRNPMSSRTAWKLAAYLIFPALIYLVSYASTAQLSQWIDLFHRGESIGPASDYLRGKVPFRDVFALHGMLEDGQLDAWLMQLFGRSLDVAVARSVVVGSLLAVSIWFLGIVVFESIPLAMLCVAMGAWTTAENNRTFFQVAAVALFWNAIKRRSRVSAIASGVFAGVALFFSYEIGLYTILGAIAATIALLRRDALKTLAFFLIGVILGTAPFLAFLAIHNAAGDFFTTSFITIPRIIDAVWALPFPDLVSTFRKDLNLHTLAEFILFEKFHLILSPLTIAIALAYYLQRRLRNRADTLDHALLVLAVFAAVTQRTAFGRAEFRHQYFAAFLLGPLLVLLAIFLVRALRNLWREGDDGTRAFIATLGVAAIPAIAVLFWIPDLVNARIDDLLNYQRRVLHVLRDGHAEEVRYRVDAVSAEIQKLTRANEPIFDFSNQPALYFFANRPNPTRFYQVPILSPREFQLETIRALERTRPKVVIRKSPEGFDSLDGVTNDLRAQAVSAYIDDRYRFYKSVRGIELWTRVANAHEQPVARYLDRMRMPSQRELVSSGVERIVFPAVGDAEGAGGSHWISELTLHNPFREAITFTMRFVSANERIDRRFTLAPRQTFRLNYVVAKLFGTTGIGTLWIEHRAGRAPVAIVKTYDAAHNGKASVESPLTPRDAASAGSDNAELTIVGIPGGAARRVNVGVVNIGIIPATFRISANGRSIESGVPEDEVWLVNDLEHQLGVTLDETTTVRITAVAGTGVAFATVIDSTGDSEFIAAIPSQQP
ncbi:MAG TPA: hypothetical protein VMU84_10195, partial [Thermoanaerobaculia bacterium]|nr:hypothetical protein [Thermoanaerobaculia bacterium]